MGLVFGRGSVVTDWQMRKEMEFQVATTRHQYGTSLNVNGSVAFNFVWSFINNISLAAFFNVPYYAILDTCRI